MSKVDLEKAFSLLEQSFDAEERDFYGSHPPTTIKNAENILKVQFPHTYKIFLKKYGSGGVRSMEIYGLTGNEDFSQKETPFVTIPNAVWTTIKRHEKFNHPHYLIPIYDVGEGTAYCLDTSQMNEEGECPVVAWPIGGYEETPVLEIIAKDFGEFFLNKVKEQIVHKNQE